MLSKNRNTQNNGDENKIFCESHISEKEALEAVKKAEEHYGMHHPGLTDSLELLSKIYETNGRQKEAEMLYKRILKIWEETFVPEYGIIHFFSDLFGGTLTRTSPYSKFVEKDVIYLKQDLLLGTGDNRYCYEHPEDSTRCIKVDKPWNYGFHNSRQKRIKKAIMPWLADFSSNREEARFYWSRVNKIGDKFYLHGPHCFGIVQTNIGPGLVFERIRDTNGCYSERLDHYVQKNPEELGCLLSLVDKLRAFLLDHELYLFTSNPDNFLVQLRDGKAYTIFVIDWKTEGRTNNDLPIYKIFKGMARNRFIEKFSELNNHLVRLSAIRIGINDR